MTTTTTNYTLDTIQSSLGLSRAVISGLIKQGFVVPSRGSKREYRFSFQDMVLLRTAHRLQQAQIPPRKILRALAQLKAQLPAEIPLTGLRISAVDQHVTVREGGAEVAVETGQLLLDFEVHVGTVGAVTVIPSSGETVVSGEDWFARGVRLEAQGDPVGAEAAYREALGSSHDRVDAALNLGVMLGESGRPGEAVAVYRSALDRSPGHALLTFNLATALEDSGSPEQALLAYEACLRVSPDMADAHFNAGRLHEQSGDKTKALRHYSAYRRLQR